MSFLGLQVIPMRNYASLFYGFLSREVTIFKRYPIDSLGVMLNFLLMFFTIFYGGKSVAPTALGESLSALVVGFFLWTTAQTTFFSLSRTISEEAQWGTLEQLYVSPFRFVTIMCAIVSSTTILSIGIGVVNLALVLTITGTSLSLNVVTIGVLLGCTLCAAAGLSFAFGGVALVYKRIQGIKGFVTFAFVGLISISLTDTFWSAFLPLGQGTVMLHQAMTEGIYLWEFPVIDHVILVGTAIGYLCLGYIVFFYSQLRVRNNGTLDQY